MMQASPQQRQRSSLPGIQLSLSIWPTLLQKPPRTLPSVPTSARSDVDSPQVLLSSRGGNSQHHERHSSLGAFKRVLGYGDVITTLQRAEKRVKTLGHVGEENMTSIAEHQSRRRRFSEGTRRRSSSESTPTRHLRSQSSSTLVNLILGEAEPTSPSSGSNVWTGKLPHWKQGPATPSSAVTEAITLKQLRFPEIASPPSSPLLRVPPDVPCSPFLYSPTLESATSPSTRNDLSALRTLHNLGSWVAVAEDGEPVLVIESPLYPPPSPSFDPSLPPPPIPREELPRSPSPSTIHGRKSTESSLRSILTQIREFPPATQSLPPMLPMPVTDNDSAFRASAVLRAMSKVCRSRQSTLDSTVESDLTSTETDTDSPNIDMGSFLTHFPLPPSHHPIILSNLSTDQVARYHQDIFSVRTRPSRGTLYDNPDVYEESDIDVEEERFRGSNHVGNVRSAGTEHRYWTARR